MCYSSATLAQESEFPLSAQKINNTFYILTQQRPYGEISIGLSVGDDGIMLIDSLPNDNNEGLIEKVKSLSKKPVKFVLNTYSQESRTGANKLFQESGATVVSALDEFPTWLAANDSTADVVYSDQLRLYFNEEDITLKRFRVHTLGDSVVKLNKSNVIFTSFAYVSNRLPQSENFDQQMDVYDYILSNSDEDTLIVPGFGKLSNKKDLASYAHGLRAIKERSIELHKQGKDINAITTDPAILGLAVQISTRINNEEERFRSNENRVLKSIVSSIVLNHTYGDSIKLSDQELLSYTGSYQSENDDIYDIIFLDGMLRLGTMTTQYFTHEISPGAKDLFYIARNGTLVSFTRNSQGQVKGLSLDHNGELTLATKIHGSE